MGMPYHHLHCLITESLLSSDLLPVVCSNERASAEFGDSNDFLCSQGLNFKAVEMCGIVHFQKGIWSYWMQAKLN